jgi:hypothetical protein
MAINDSGSRYFDTPPFDPPDGGRPPFRGLRPRHIGPALGVIEHVLREGDRLDLLALHYYNDPRRWWRIADANPEVVHAADLTLREQAGSVILIPRSVEPGVRR